MAAGYRKPGEARTQAGHKPTGAHGLVGVRLRPCCVWLPRPLRLPPPQVDHPHHGNPGQQGKAARLGHRLFANALAPVGGEDGGVGVVDVAVAVGRRRDGPFRPGRSPWQERKQATSPRGLMAWLVFDCGRALRSRPLRLPPPQVDHPHHGNPGQQGKAARLGHRLFTDALAPVGGEDGGVGVVDVAVGRRRDGPFRPGRSPWQERKQATSPRGLMAWLVFDCGRASGRGRYAFRRRK